MVKTLKRSALSCNENQIANQFRTTNLNIEFIYTNYNSPQCQLMSFNLRFRKILFEFSFLRWKW